MYNHINYSMQVCSDNEIMSTMADRQVDKVKTPTVTTCQQLEQSRGLPKASAVLPIGKSAVATSNTVGSSKVSAVAKVKEPEDGSSGEPQQTRKV